MQHINVVKYFVDAAIYIHIRFTQLLIMS